MSREAIANLVAFLTECDVCCRDSVFSTNDGEQLCDEHLRDRTRDWEEENQKP